MFARLKRPITSCLAVACLTLTLLAEAASEMSSAQDIEVMDDARVAFTEGRWQKAARLGEAAATAEGYALAAEALSIYAHYFLETESERPEVLLHAIELAERAVHLQPEDPWIAFQLAHAVGRYAQNIPTPRALLDGHLSRSRQLAEDVLVLDRDMTYAHLQLGSWHAEVVSRAGKIVANLTYGARPSKALEHYEHALRLAEDDLVVYAEVGRGLLTLSRRKHGKRAEELLRHAISLEPKDAYARMIVQRARRQLVEF